MKEKVRIALCGFVLAVLCLSANGQSQRPLIGISCNWSEEVVSVSHTYIQAVEQAGGLPVPIPFSNDTTVLQAQIDRVDALVMIGGEDFDPWLYGEEPHPMLGTVHMERDRYDLYLIRCALRKGIPLLGICRGLQGLNVVEGGSLYQDLPSTYPNPCIRHRQGAERQFGSHTVRIAPDSRLHAIVGLDSLRVNSFHHQAVRQAAPGYRIVASSPDGVIEALEKEGKHWIIGVQWHPEALNLSGDEPSHRLFQELIRQASRSQAR